MEFITNATVSIMKAILIVTCLEDNSTEAFPMETIKSLVDHGDAVEVTFKRGCERKSMLWVKKYHNIKILFR